MFYTLVSTDDVLLSNFLFSLWQEYPEYVAYVTPMFFCDDWLNLYLDNFRIHIDSDTQQPDKEICCSDYRFVYMGVKGVIIGVINSSRVMHIRLFCTFLYTNEMK